MLQLLELGAGCEVERFVLLLTTGCLVKIVKVVTASVVLDVASLRSVLAECGVCLVTKSE